MRRNHRDVSQLTSIRASQRITQAELAEFQELKRLAKELSDRALRMRATIRDKLEAGVFIEPGVLTASLRIQESRSFSYEKLVNVVGQEYTDVLRDQIEPTISKQVIVKNSE